MSRVTLSIAALFYACSVVCLSFIRIPFVSLSGDFQKGILAACMLGIACMLAGGITLLSRRGLVVPFNTLSLAGFGLLIVSAVSWGATGFMSMSVWGLGFDMGTVGSFALFLGALVAGSLVSVTHIRALIHVYIAAVASVGFITVVIFLFGGDASLFSSWPQLSLATAVGLLCVSALHDWGNPSLGARVLLICEGIVLTIVFLLFFNTAGAAIAVTLLGIFCAVHILLSEYGHTQARFPIYASLLIVVFLLALFFMREPILSVPPEIRLTLAATELIGGPVYFSNIQSALFGSGPNSFADVWDRYQPVEVNTTPLWNTSFAVGYSTAATFAVTLGVFGIFVLFAYPLFFFFWSYVQWRRAPTTALAGRADVVLSAVFIAAYACIAGVVYTITLPLFLVGALALGFLIRLLQPQAVHSVSPIVSKLFIRIPVAFLFLLCGGGLLWVSTHQFLAAYYHAEGVAAFEKKDITTAAHSLQVAHRIWATPQYATDASRVFFEAASNAALASSTDSAGIQDQISQAVFLSSTAVSLAPKSYITYISNSSLYVGLTALGVSGAEAQASSSISIARGLGPVHPEVPYLRAVLCVGLGRIEEGRENLKKSLMLKPDYEPALELLKRIGE